MTQSGPLPGSGPREQASQPRQPQSRVPVTSARPGSAAASALTAGLSASTAPGPVGLVYADLPNRVVAYLIDLIIISTVGFLIEALLAVVFGDIGNAAGDLNLVSLVLFGGGYLVVAAVYFVSLWSWQRATVGMRLLGLRIGDERDGRAITTGAGLLRWVILGIPSILATSAAIVPGGLGVLLGLVGLVWLVALLASVAMSPTKQGYHDRAAHTIIVKAPRRLAA